MPQDARLLLLSPPPTPSFGVGWAASSAKKAEGEQATEGEHDQDAIQSDLGFALTSGTCAEKLFTVVIYEFPL